MQQLVLARCGLRDTFLGFPVVPDPKSVLYIAADRPKQARRSFRRMILETDRAVLEEKLRVYEGGPTGSIIKDPSILLRAALEVGAGTVVLDSLKDLVPDLSSDEGGQAAAQALQLLIVEEIEVAVLHHPRKRTSGGTVPHELSDAYGSRWITAVTGSVVLLHGSPGDSHVRMLHLKQPGAVVGPLHVVHDATAGRSVVADRFDILAFVRTAAAPVSAKDVAAAMYEVTEPDKNQTERVRKKLESLIKGTQLLKVAGTRSGGGKAPTLYGPVVAAGIP